MRQTGQRQSKRVAAVPISVGSVERAKTVTTGTGFGLMEAAGTTPIGLRHSQMIIMDRLLVMTASNNTGMQWVGEISDVIFRSAIHCVAFQVPIRLLAYFEMLEPLVTYFEMLCHFTREHN